MSGLCCFVLFCVCVVGCFGAVLVKVLLLILVCRLQIFKRKPKAKLPQPNQQEESSAVITASYTDSEGSGTEHQPQRNIMPNLRVLSLSKNLLSDSSIFNFEFLEYPLLLQAFVRTTQKRS